jgi:hypothetical protein
MTTYPPTKGERREVKKKKMKKMGVDGSSVKLLLQIIGKKAKSYEKVGILERIEE